MNYIWYGAAEDAAVVDALLAAGARPELCETWKRGWGGPEMLARRDWLEGYIKMWYERRARERAAASVPGFDYAL